MPTDFFFFSFYYSKWDCSKFLSVNILSMNIHSLQNLALRICDKAAALIWFFCRYPLYRNPSFMIILWSQLFVQQKATLLWKSMLAFWSSLARILFHKIKLINSHTNQIMIHSVIISILKPKISVYYYGVPFFSKIYYSEVIYGINQSVSPEFFTITRFFTIRKFTNARFHCNYRQIDIIVNEQNQ